MKVFVGKSYTSVNPEHSGAAQFLPEYNLARLLSGFRQPVVFWGRERKPFLTPFGAKILCDAILTIAVFGGVAYEFIRLANGLPPF